jgi:hypothetical protein
VPATDHLVFAVQDPLESPDCVCQAQAIQQEVFHKGLPTGNLDAMGDLARAFAQEDIAAYCIDRNLLVADALG